VHRARLARDPFEVVPTNTYDHMTTRKLSFSLALACASFLYTHVHGQTAGNTFGLKGGLNVSNFQSAADEVDDRNARIGFHAGVFGRVAANDAIALQGELLYSTRGTKLKYEGLLIEQDLTFSQAYLDLPIFVAIRLADVIELHAGGYVGYMLSSDVSSSGDLGDFSGDLDRDNFKSMDYGLLAGAGVNLGPAQLGVRYMFGLNELADNSGARLLLGDARHSVAQLYLAIGLTGVRD
jgi:hypothetical protein